MDAHDTVVAMRAHRRDLARDRRAWCHFVAGVFAGIAGLSVAFLLTAMWSSR